MKSSHIPWKWKWHVCTDFGSRRGEAMERKKMVLELLLLKPGGHVLSHNLAGPEGGL
jgi:hypothetical protein